MLLILPWIQSLHQTRGDSPTTRFDGSDTSELVFGEHDDADRSGLLVDMREGEPADRDGELEQPRLWDE